MTSLACQLSACGYTLSNCAERLGVFPRLGVNFWPMLRRKWTPDPNDPVDTLLDLFIDGRDVRADRLTRHASPDFIHALLETGLAQKEGPFLHSEVCLFPCYGKFIVTDKALKNTGINQVMWLWAESYILGGLVKRIPRRCGIDMGTGSGVHAILASDHCQRVVGVDINPRALDFARFNAALNGADNVEFVLSDLFNSVESTCDLLLANPPYLPDSGAQPGDNFWSGGVAGFDLLGRIVRALPARLDRDGTAHIIALYPFPPKTRIRDYFDRWLGGALGAYEVLDHTWPVPNHQDILSERPFEGDKSGWRFGVVSLRRSGNGKGWWKEVGGNGMFFREDGSTSVVADHDEL
ncbi:MAG: class I SAM-dependent methyltransferase [Terracidiphilus sp.]|jgi:SAM-dependent methyltransferase